MQKNRRHQKPSAPVAEVAIALRKLDPATADGLTTIARRFHMDRERYIRLVLDAHVAATLHGAPASIVIPVPTVATAA